MFEIFFLLIYRLLFSPVVPCLGLLGDAVFGLHHTHLPVVLNSYTAMSAPVHRNSLTREMKPGPFSSLHGL